MMILGRELRTPTPLNQQKVPTTTPSTLASYTVSETAASETVTIHGVSRPNPAYSGGTYTATYTMTPTDAEGAVVGYVSVTDNAGNSRAITVPWTVTFDRTTPLATLVTLTTSNPYTNGGPWARVRRRGLLALVSLVVCLLVLFLFFVLFCFVFRLLLLLFIVVQ